MRLGLYLIRSTVTLGTMDRSINAVEHNARGLRVWLDDVENPVDVSWFWVRDHSEDLMSLEANNQQRLVDTFAINPRVVATSASVRDGVVEVTWPSDPPSILSATLFGELTPASVGAGRTLWRRPDQLGVSGYATLA